MFNPAFCKKFKGGHFKPFNMKYLLFFSLAVFSFFSCKNSTNNSDQTTDEPTGSAGSQDHPDLAAITDVIHNFYKWYGTAQAAIDINYLNLEGKYPKLDNANVDAYYELIAASGFISNEYVESEKAYLKKCEAAWEKEKYEDGPLPGLDADRFFCAQDWDLNFWTMSPVTAEGLGTDRVKATMSGTEGGSPQERKFELKKENGKWLITKIECDMGIE